MRIIIETDEKQPAPVVKTTAETAATTTTSPPDTSPPQLPAISAGAPPADLLQALGETTAVVTPNTYYLPGTLEAKADAMAGGPPPDWLVQAIESAHSPRFGKS